MSHKFTSILSGLALFFISQLTYGESEDRCKIIPFPAIASPEFEARQTPLADGESLISAEQMSREGEVMTLQGKAILVDNQQRISAEEIIYDQQGDSLFLKGRVNYQSGNFRIKSESGEFHPNAGSGTFNRNNFQIPERGANGSAEKITLIDAQHRTLEGVRYTTCPPDNKAWEMSASSMELDQESNVGEAYNVTLRFQKVPFIYIPYINFPLKGRKTGLLPPTFSNSERNGTDVALPWYWNIAPDYDATITPRSIQKRGTMLMNEFRFLTHHGGGEINVDYLPNDKLDNNSRRQFGSFRHLYQEDNWYGTVDINSVSDDNYLNDLGSSGSNIDNSSVRLQQRIEHGYRTPTLNLKLNIQSYQELTPSPIYQRLPQLTLAWNPKYESSLKFSLNTEWTRFGHATDSKTTGDRLDVRPSLRYPIESASGFIRPKLTLRHTRYQLDDTIEQPSHSIPIVSIDNGLFFDRYFRLGDSPYQQTLEPRLYYLYAPYIDQSSYPNFDTSAIAFSWSQLFQENRFSGADRQIDANQISLSLSSRFIESKSGVERLRLSLGKMVTLSEPKVDLGNSWSGSHYENLIAEIAFRPHNEWQLTHSQQFSKDENEDFSTSIIKYNSQKYGRASVSYRRDESTQLRQSDIIANLRLSTRWHIIGRRLHDINQQQTLEDILGFEYESCCWTGRLVTLSEWKSDTQQLERSYLFNIEFKGLGKIGRDIESLLGSGIMSH